MLSDKLELKSRAGIPKQARSEFDPHQRADTHARRASDGEHDSRKTGYLDTTVSDTFTPAFTRASEHCESSSASHQLTGHHPGPRGHRGDLESARTQTHTHTVDVPMESTVSTGPVGRGQRAHARARASRGVHSSAVDSRFVTANCLAHHVRGSTCLWHKGSPLEGAACEAQATGQSIQNTGQQRDRARASHRYLASISWCGWIVREDGVYWR